MIDGKFLTRRCERVKCEWPGAAARSAKDVIDIDLTVADPRDEEAYVPRLVRIGDTLAVREPSWHEHRCRRLAEPRVNLHVFGSDCPETVRHRMFRDRLRTHPEDRARYEAAKRAAGMRWALGQRPRTGPGFRLVDRDHLVVGEQGKTVTVQFGQIVLAVAVRRKRLHNNRAARMPFSRPRRRSAKRWSCARRALRVVP